MTFHSTLASIVTALALALSTPVSASGQTNENKTTTPILTNSSTTTAKNTNLEEITLSSGSSNSLRLELPNDLLYSVTEKTFDLLKNPKCYYLPKDKSVYCLVNLEGEYQWRSLIPLLTPSSNLQFLENFTLPEKNLYQIHQIFLKESSAIVQDGTKLLNNYWNGINQALSSREVETAVTFSAFFRDLLPDYTQDGIITPSELTEIETKVKKQVEEYYQITLNETEQKAISDATDQFKEGFNLLKKRYSTVNTLNQLNLAKNNFFDLLCYKGIPLSHFYEVFTHFSPLYELKLSKHSFQLTSNLYGRFNFHGDQYRQFEFNNHLFRESFLSTTTAITEAHLQLDGEIYQGDLIRNLFNTEYAKTLNQLELLLGYQPVLIDSSLNGKLDGFLDFKTAYLFGVEEFLKEKNIGFGLTHGYLYLIEANANAQLSASMNSFKDKINFDFSGYLRIDEFMGQTSSVYFFSQHFNSKQWHSFYFGATTKQLRTLERLWIAKMNFQSNYLDKGSYQDLLQATETSRLLVQNSLQAFFVGGLNLPDFSPFLIIQPENIGSGFFLNTSHLHTELEAGLNGYLTLNSSLLLRGKSCKETTKTYFIQKQQTVYSLFPARQAVLDKIEHDYLSSQNALLVETSIELKEPNQFPHQQPLLAKLSLLAGSPGELYLKFTGSSSLDQRIYGFAGMIGNNYFQTKFSYQRELIPERGTYADNLTAGLNIYLEQFQINTTAYLYPSRLTRTILHHKKGGEIGFQFFLTGHF